MLGGALLGATGHAPPRMETLRLLEDFEALEETEEEEGRGNEGGRERRMERGKEGWGKGRKGREEGRLLRPGKLPTRYFY